MADFLHPVLIGEISVGDDQADRNTEILRVREQVAPLSPLIASYAEYRGMEPGSALIRGLEFSLAWLLRIGLGKVHPDRVLIAFAAVLGEAYPVVCELLYRAQSREGFKAKEHAAMEAIIARAAKWLVAVPKGEYFIEEAEARRLLRELLTVYEAYLKKPRTD